jgi:diguanylate cyclase (GGDEF)-like protein
VLPATTALSTQRLAEFLTVVSAAADPISAIQVATERVARALEAEVAVVLDADGAVSSVGFAFGRVPFGALADVISGERMLEVPGAGLCHAISVALTGGIQGHLVVARSGGEGYAVDEMSLLRGMAKALDLTVATLRTVEAERRQSAENGRLLASLRARQRLLEQLSTIQRAITRRAPLADILGAITLGAHELIGDEIAALRMIDPEEPGIALLVSSIGLPESAVHQIWRVQIGDAGVSGLAIQRNELVVLDDYPTAPGNLPDAAALAIQTAMAAPVHENSTVIGSLAIATRRRGRVYSRADQETLQVFAEQVSLAVTDARTQDAIHQAYHDSLTGLASRALFLDRLSHALARAVRERGHVAVIYFDLDRFKKINDSLGHSAGDSLLIGVADRLRGCLTGEDTAARLGGDEFAVIVHEATDEDRVIVLARHLIDQLRMPFLLHGHETYIDASVGIAFSLDGEQDAQSLMRDADLAMYQAKKDGKGRYEIFQPTMRALFLRSLEIEAKLRRAVDRGDFVLRYQPIVDLHSGQIVGLEALVRWYDQAHGLVAPREFIPLAEETGLILPIDRWVLAAACRQAATWNERAGQFPLSVSVNLSARQLQQADLTGVVAGVLASTGLEPRCLVIEITESLLLHDTDTIMDRLRSIKALGVRVAIDDFGTGYSSLSYLRQFPVDIIKIDKSFVDGAEPGSQASALAQAIVQIGKILRLTTVAEGIETAEQLGELRAAGCELAQGFYFAAPLSADQVEQILRDRLTVVPVLG